MKGCLASDFTGAERRVDQLALFFFSLLDVLRLYFIQKL